MMPAPRGLGTRLAAQVLLELYRPSPSQKPRAVNGTQSYYCVIDNFKGIISNLVVRARSSAGRGTPCARHYRKFWGFGFFLAPTGHKDAVTKFAQRGFPITVPTYSSCRIWSKIVVRRKVLIHGSKISNFKELTPFCKHIINSQGECGFKGLIK